MTIKEELDKQIIKCGKIAKGRGKCIICKCTKSKKGMLIHHRWYITDDVIYSNPKYLPKNDSTRLQYYIDLYPLIVACPERFSYQCGSDHYSLGKFINYGDAKFNALSKERKLSRRR